MNNKTFNVIIKKAINFTILTNSDIYDKVENFVVHNYCHHGWDRKTLIENWKKNIFEWCRRKDIIHLFRPNYKYWDRFINMWFYNEREYHYESFMCELIDYFDLFVSPELQEFKTILKKFIQYKNNFIKDNFLFSIRGDEIRIGGESQKYSVKEFRKWFESLYYIWS
jgi:hypothetical protein